MSVREVEKAVKLVGKEKKPKKEKPVDEALEMTKTLDPVLIDVCNTISI